ncbi:MAG: response regulator transcription factor [Hyphomicrobiales bacterium]|nr:response regulator transcription factor [Hyphomicrobiales bacterium]MDE2115021.1 response regulator transcription factor [Hyphomicrobiales bacterium]
MRVLLVEDDAMIGRELTAALERQGMIVDWVRDGPTGAEAMAVGTHAIVLLDIGLPGQSGLCVLRDARRSGIATPVLVITARDGLDERIEGLNLGADDYIIKPFDFRELIARMRATLRRHNGAAQSLLQAGAITLDLSNHTLAYQGTSLVLPAREFSLMQALMLRPGTILSRTQIEERIYGWGEEVESNAVDVLIHTIRKKFDRDIIHNVRGAGWMVLKGGS